MKNTPFKVVIVLIALSLTLLSLEIFLRVNLSFGHIYDSFRLLNKSEAPMLRHFKDNCLRPSALLGYENIPGCDRNNAYGLVGKQYNLNKDKECFRILLIGDSIAWCDWIRQSLEGRLFNEISSKSKYTFEIWNAGCPSYDVRRYYLYLKYGGLSCKPDMVLIFMFMNDFGLDINFYYKNKEGAMAYYSPFTEISKRFTVNPLLIKYSYLYRFVISRLNMGLLNKARDQGIDQNEQDGLYYLQLIKEICAKNNISLSIVIFPYLKPLDDYSEGEKSQLQGINAVVEKLEINYFSLYNLYDRLLREKFSLRDRKDDDIHPSEEASGIIANEIYNYLTSRFYDFRKLERENK